MKATNFTLALVIFFLSAFVCQVKAQNEIFGLAGYLLNGDVTVAEGDLSFDDGFTYGLGIDIPVDRMMSAEINWSMSSSKITLYEYLGPTREISDINIHHFQAGALIEPEKNKKVSPFGLLTLGAALYSPVESNIDDEWRFSVALGGGFKVNISDKVGLRFQGRLIIPMQFAGGSVYVGTGGAGVSVGTWTTFVEGDFMGGLYVRL